MSRSRVMSACLFVLGVFCAWNLAQPSNKDARQQDLPRATVPGDPLNDAVNTRQLVPQERLIVTPPEPLKFSLTERQ